ncbi:MAG: ATP-binding cassette domain-containing protein [Candidatus Methanomethyliaceae archaeon]
MDDIHVEMRNISKHFGAIIALNDVTFLVERGKVHGLVGDNGAGKSTLMKILSGALQPDKGMIILDGKERRFRNPLEARAAGIEMIYQDFALVPQLSVVENIFLARELTSRMGFLQKKAMESTVRRLAETLGIEIKSFRAKVRELSGGQQQGVAILRALAFAARLVIMDEPTAALSPAAVEKVRELIRNLRAHGTSVIVISHRIEDIFATGDWVTILKHGEIVATLPISKTHPDVVVEMIVYGKRALSRNNLNSGAKAGEKTVEDKYE